MYLAQEQKKRWKNVFFFYKSCEAQFKKVIRCCRRQFAAALTPDKQTTRGSQPLTDRLS
jgi:hypothetical protein